MLIVCFSVVLCTEFRARYIKERCLLQQMNLCVQACHLPFDITHALFSSRIDIYRIVRLYTVPLSPSLTNIPIILPYQQCEPMLGICFCEFPQRVRGIRRSRQTELKVTHAYARYTYYIIFFLQPLYLLSCCLQSLLLIGEDCAWLQRVVRRNHQPDFIHLRMCCHPSCYSRMPEMQRIERTAVYCHQHDLPDERLNLAVQCLLGFSQIVVDQYRVKQRRVGHLYLGFGQTLLNLLR